MKIINHKILKMMTIVLISTVAVVFMGCGSTTRLDSKSTASRKSTKNNPMATWNKKAIQAPTTKLPDPDTNNQQRSNAQAEYKSPTIPGYTPPEPFNPANVNSSENGYSEAVTGEPKKYTYSSRNNYDDEDYSPAKSRPVSNKTKKNKNYSVKYSANKNINYSNATVYKRTVAVAVPAKRKIQVVKIPVKYESKYESPKEIALKIDKEQEMQTLFISGVSAARAGDHAKATAHMKQVMNLSSRSDLRKKAKIYYERSAQNTNKTD